MLCPFFTRFVRIFLQNQHMMCRFQISVASTNGRRADLLVRTNVLPMSPNAYASGTTCADHVRDRSWRSPPNPTSVPVRWARFKESRSAKPQRSRNAAGPHSSHCRSDCTI